MSRLNAVTKHQLHTSGGLQRVGPLLAETHPEFVISKRRMRKVESINWVRLNREGCPTEPRLLIAAICPPRTSNKTSVVRLPLPRTPKRPVCSSGHRSSKLRLALGQDRLVPIFLATLAIRQQTPQITFESAAQMLDTFGMQQGGTQYRRLVGAFQRIFGATMSR